MRTAGRRRAPLRRARIIGPPRLERQPEARRGHVAEHVASGAPCRACGAFACGASFLRSSAAGGKSARRAGPAGAVNERTLAPRTPQVPSHRFGEAAGRRAGSDRCARHGWWRARAWRPSAARGVGRRCRGVWRDAARGEEEGRGRRCCAACRRPRRSGCSPPIRKRRTGRPRRSTAGRRRTSAATRRRRGSPGPRTRSCSPPGRARRCSRPARPRRWER